MELSRLFFCLFALAAADDFGWSRAKLEANIMLKANHSWHLGGFCFGKADPAEAPDGKVAEVWILVDWRGSVPLNSTGPIMLVAFDARESRWGAVKDTWDKTSCREKLLSATMVRRLGQYSVNSKYWFRVHVHQKSAMRDWHFALLTCGNVEQAPLMLQLRNADGALSMFQANTTFHTSSCPYVAVGWWQAAQEDPSFWLLLVGTLGVGSGLAAGVLQLKKRCTQKKFSQMAATQGVEPVVGKPCMLLGRTDAGIVQGKPHEGIKDPSQPTKASGSLIPTGRPVGA